MCIKLRVSHRHSRIVTTTGTPVPRPVQRLDGKAKTSTGYKQNPSSSTSTGGQTTEYAPPSGPPPDRLPQKDDWDAPPPSEKAADASKAKTHDWQGEVPDTSLFPPPPALFSGYDVSPANNATEAEAQAGEDWCLQYPLAVPMVTNDPGCTAHQFPDIQFVPPQDFKGTLQQVGSGRWDVTTRDSPDRSIIGWPPMYIVNKDDPIRFGSPRTIYYEVQLLRSGSDRSMGSVVALGFTALPYPTFRLPGWHRGSLGVHSDDGHRYINDLWGGKDFTTPFKMDETLGIGMTFKPTGPPRSSIEVSVFFTRDGVLTGSWDLHEETDSQKDRGITGLAGFHDLTCAIGVCGNVDIKVMLNEANWKYKGHA